MRPRSLSAEEYVHEVREQLLPTNGRHIFHCSPLFDKPLDEGNMLFWLNVGKGVGSSLAWSGPAQRLAT